MRITQASHSGWSMSPLAMNMPTANSSESPGRKKPRRSPVSANTIATAPHNAQVPRASRIVSGLSHSRPAMKTLRASTAV